MFRIEEQRKGFTLLELIAVIVILGVLAALAFPSFSTVKSKSTEKTAISSAEGIVRDARALAALDGAVLSDSYVDQAGAETSEYDATTNSLSVEFNGNSAIASINPVTGEVTVTSSGNSNSSGGGGASTGMVDADTLEEGSYPTITITKTGPVHLALASGYLSRLVPVRMVFSDHPALYHYDPVAGRHVGLLLRPVLYDASGNLLTGSLFSDTGYTRGVVDLGTVIPTPTPPTGATYYAQILDYTNPYQASWYRSSSDVFAGASMAFRVSDADGNTLGYTNRVAVNWE